MLESNWMPTTEQRLLLQAALLTDVETVRQAYGDWLERVDVNTLSHESNALLGLLYCNLEMHQINEGPIAIFKGVYRRTWTKNQIFFSNLNVLLAALSANNIQPILLKGMALTVANFYAMGARDMGDVDLLFKPSDLTQVFSLLSNHGYEVLTSALPQSSEAYMRTRHAIGFFNANQPLENIDVHWRFMTSAHDAEEAKQLFAQASNVQYQKQALKILPLEELLLQAIAHGICFSPVPLIRWVADAMTLLQKSKGNIDWQRFCQLAKIHKVVLPVRTGLRYLLEYFDCVEVKPALDNLNQTLPSYSERRLFILSNQRNNPLQIIQLLWWLHYESLQKQNWLSKFFQFPEYLKHMWSLTSRAQLPWAMLRRCFKRFYLGRA